MPRLNMDDPFQMLFWEECREQIQTIEQELLAIEAGTSTEETLHNIFRMAHSIKGSAATLELEDLNKLAHAMESLLTLVKNRMISLTLDVMDALLYGIDQLKTIHKALLEMDDECREVPLAIALIEQQIKTSKTNLKKNYRIKVVFDSNAELLSLKAFIVANALTEVSEQITVQPLDYENLEDEDLQEGIEIELVTQASRAKLGEILNGITELKIADIRESDVSSESPSGTILKIESPTERAIEKKTESELIKNNVEKTRSQSTLADTGAVKVSVKRMDQLINLMGEFVIEKEILNNITKTMKKERKKDAEVQRLIEVAEHISVMSGELREILLSTRMMPLEVLFSRFYRMVRDISQKCAKNVQLTIEGKEISIDREMIEALVDPITHLLRNAIDHGIECECERVKSGKSPVGHIKISAKQESDFVLITIQDDGNGINSQMLKQKIVEKGYLTEAQAEQLDDYECIQYIFLPGFSTAQRVCEISGRGVGLDVVKTNINRLQGYVNVSSIENLGTTFTIKLPMTLTIIKALLVKNSGIMYLVPKATLVETFRLKEDEIQEQLVREDHLLLLKHGNRRITAKYLPSDFSQSDNPSAVNDLWRKGKLFVLIIGGLEGQMAILVDEVMGEQEVVVKSMGGYIGEDRLFGTLKGITGASILGDGGLAYVIDPYFLF